MLWVRSAAPAGSCLCGGFAEVAPSPIDEELAELEPEYVKAYGLPFERLRTVAIRVDPLQQDLPF